MVIARIAAAVAFELDAQARQAEEDEEQLHDERRVADQLDIAGALRRGTSRMRLRRAVGAEHAQALPRDDGDGDQHDRRHRAVDAAPRRRPD